MHLTNLGFLNSALARAGLMLALVVSASTVHALPTHGDVTHFDLTDGSPHTFNPLNNDFNPAVGGPCGYESLVLHCDFGDNVFNPSGKHHLEITFFANTAFDNFIVGYRKPDGSAFWELNVAAGGSVEIHTHYADTPDFGGAWKFVVSTETNPAFIDDNNLPTFPPFSVVASVTENRDPTTAEVPDFLLTVQGGSFRLLDPPDEQRILISDLFFELQAVPEPGTMLLVGTGLLGAGWLRRKQKSRRS